MSKDYLITDRQVNKVQLHDRDIRKQWQRFQGLRLAINQGNITCAVPIIGLAKIIQDLLIKKVKFFCVFQKDEESFKVVRGVVDDFNFCCLECVSKVDQDSMINLCDRIGVKEDLSTVPVKLSDIGKVKNPNSMTETFYLDNKSDFSHT